MRGKDWPNLRRMFNAMILLLISPLVGIAVGAIFWGSLERGLLVFNLLGLLGFSMVTRPYWRGNRKRIRKLFTSAIAVGISAGLDVISGRPVPFAVYFASMVECFSLIPWIIEILQEIHQGLWRKGPAPVPPSFSQPSTPKTTPAPWSKPKPTLEGPELPIPGVPRWVFLLIALLLALVAGILLWQAGVGSAPAPRRFTP